MHLLGTNQVGTHVEEMEGKMGDEPARHEVFINITIIRGEEHVPPVSSCQMRKGEISFFH